MTEKQINYSSLVIEDIDFNDAPDFCDAYFSYGEYMDGGKLEDSVLEELSCGDYKYECIYNTVY